MTTDLVIARYCEDLLWARFMPTDWRCIVYDKSEGGPRQGLDIGTWQSTPGPDGATAMSGAIQLPNKGGEAHTFFVHVAARYNDLADYTVFVPGDFHTVTDNGDGTTTIGPGHWPNAVSVILDGIAEGRRFIANPAMGVCTDDGAEHHPGLGPNLRKLFGALRPDWPLPPVIDWHQHGIFAATRECLRDIPRDNWIRAAQLCEDKADACAMERLWGLVLNPPPRFTRMLGI